MTVNQPQPRRTKFGVWFAMTIPAAVFALVLSMLWYEGVIWPDSGSWVWYLITFVPLVPSFLTLPLACGRSLKNNLYFVTDLVVALACGGLAAANACFIPFAADSAIQVGIAVAALFALIALTRIWVDGLDFAVRLAATTVLASTIGMIFAVFLAVVLKASDALAYSVWGMAAVISFIAYVWASLKRQAASATPMTARVTPPAQTQSLADRLCAWFRAIDWDQLWSSVDDIRMRPGYLRLVHRRRWVFAGLMAVVIVIGLLILNGVLNRNEAPGFLVWIGTNIFQASPQAVSNFWLRFLQICCLGPLSIAALAILIAILKPRQGGRGGHIVSPVLMTDCPAFIRLPVRRIAFIRHPRRDWWLLWPTTYVHVDVARKILHQDREAFLRQGPGNEDVSLAAVNIIRTNLTIWQLIFNFGDIQLKTPAGDDVEIPIKWRGAKWPKKLNDLGEGYLTGIEAVKMFLYDIRNTEVKDGQFVLK